MAFGNGRYFALVLFSSLTAKSNRRIVRPQHSQKLLQEHAFAVGIRWRSPRNAFAPACLEELQSARKSAVQPGRLLLGKVLIDAPLT